MIKKVAKKEVRARRHFRVRKKVSGTALCPRLCVYRANANIHAQIIDDTTGNTLCAASSVALKLANGGNIEAAKLVGAKIAEFAIAKGIKKVVFDRGGCVFHGRVKALADAARAGGLEF